MRLLIAVLLSVALIGLHPQDLKQNINNSEEKVKVAVKADPVKTEPAKPVTSVKPVETPAPTPPAPPTPPTTHEGIMQAAGISPSDYGYVDYIISHESSWRWNAREPNTGAYGLCQALPATKLATAGLDWQTNPVTQLKWCSSYAVSRYGSWAGAYQTWVAQRWW